MGVLNLKCDSCGMQFSQRDALGNPHVKCPVCSTPLRAPSPPPSVPRAKAPANPSITDESQRSVSKLRWGCFFIAAPIATLPGLLMLSIPKIHAAFEAGGFAPAFAIGGLVGAIVGSVCGIVFGVLLIRKSGI